MFIETIDIGPVRRLTLNRPETKNAIPPQGWSALADAFEAFEMSSQRVLVVTGAEGDFCSGADLGTGEPEVVLSAAGRAGRMKLVGRAALALHRLSKPTIAAVDGVAAGAGMNLALGCDLVLASERARFSEIFVRRGLTVDFGGTWILPRLIGIQRARELIFSGRIVEAAEAKEIGLVLDIVGHAELIDAAQNLAEQLATSAPIPQMLAKQTLNRSFELSLEEAIEEENQAQAICLGTQDVAEGIAAFLAKRLPEFKGR